MRKLFSFSSLLILAAVLYSCQKEKAVVPAAEEPVSEAVLAQITAQGYSNKEVQRTEGGYIVEGDIFLSDQELSVKPNWGTLIFANVEQYRTNNLVSVSGSRNITISMSNKLPSSYRAALDEAIARYNAQNLKLTFSRVSSRGNIVIDAAPRNAQYLASAGFPSSKGAPYNSVKVNSSYLGNNPGTAYLATILAHEIGHCIGFRHTDYMDRSYSCGGSPYNEGASTVGAVHIPGTPTGPDSNSWMLSCIGSGQNRPFNTNDRTALDYLY